MSALSTARAAGAEPSRSVVLASPEGVVQGVVMWWAIDPIAVSELADSASRCTDDLSKGLRSAHDAVDEAAGALAGVPKLGSALTSATDGYRRLGVAAVRRSGELVTAVQSNVRGYIEADIAMSLDTVRAAQVVDMFPPGMWVPR
ncbi:hypothetical protein [Microbacterium sp.]|uniref:hypothetical protein n=1 Tax=Microbacterium sp. TaxID=51671 RepID=UPI003A8BDAED